MQTDPPDQKPGFVKRWVFSTLLGWALATLLVFALVNVQILIVQLLDYPTRTSEFDILSSILGFLVVAAFGAIIGIVQWRIGLRGSIPLAWWVIASIASTFGCIAAGIILIRTPNPLFTEYRLSDTWFTTLIIWSVGVGLALSVPKWIALKLKHFQPNRLIISSILSGFFVMAIFIYLVHALDDDDDLLSLLMSRCLAPFIFAFMTGLALQHILKRTPSS